jgi:photosystem II stability/assembly factor-like uncharacterized protein
MAVRDALMAMTRAMAMACVAISGVAATGVVIARTAAATPRQVASASQAPAGMPQWTAQQSGVTARFRGVSAVSDSVAWASGTDGTIVRTVDGGATWQRLTVSDPGAEKLDFRDIDAMDARVAYALSIGPGEASRIYKTIDGGQSWTKQFVNADPKAFFDAMTFWTPDRGIAISDSVDGRFVIMLTRDGGRTWTRAPLAGLPSALPNEGAFAASGTNVAVYGRDHVWIGTGAAAKARVLRSSDGGRTWLVSDTPLQAGPSAGIFSIAFRDAKHGIIVGGDYKKEGEAVDNVAVTDDGGATWTLVKTHALSGFRSVVSYLPVPGAKSATTSTRTLIAIGPSGADVSTDDGRTWQPIDCPGYHTFSPAPRGTTGWGAGEQGRIGRLR